MLRSYAKHLTVGTLSLLGRVVCHTHHKCLASRTTRAFIGAELKTEFSRLDMQKPHRDFAAGTTRTVDAISWFEDFDAWI